jgi:hypothetical protein
MGNWDEPRTGLDDEWSRDSGFRQDQVIAFLANDLKPITFKDPNQSGVWIGVSLRSVKEKIVNK